MSDANHFTFPPLDLANSRIESVVAYGPPRTRRARLMNRLRRLFGRDEQDEILGIFRMVDGELVEVDEIHDTWEINERYHGHIDVTK
jgi:hypothetical protein